LGLAFLASSCILGGEHLAALKVERSAGGEAHAAGRDGADDHTRVSDDGLLHDFNISQP
jgi:hypothetical protein